MKTPDHLAPLLEPLAAFQRLLDRHGEQGILIGGVATSLLGAPRLTADIDGLFLMSIDDLPVFMGMAEEEGFLPRIPDAVAFARNNRVLLLVHSNTGINIYISLGILPSKKKRFNVATASTSEIFRFSCHLSKISLS